MRDQLADATAAMVAEYNDKPIIVVGDYNAAASSIDRATNKMYPYDEDVNALMNLLTRLSFTDLHRQKFKTQRHVEQYHRFHQVSHRRDVRERSYLCNDGRTRTI